MSSRLIIDFNSIPAYRQLVDSCFSDERIAPLGLPRGARLALISAIARDLKCPILYLVAHSDRAQVVLDELNFWAPDIPHQNYAEPATLFYEKMPWGETTRLDRIRALTSLAFHWLPGKKEKATNPILLSTVKAAMTRTVARRDFLTHCVPIKPGKSSGLEAIVQKAVTSGYQISEVVVTAGQVSRRGGIIDIWMPVEPLPIRIEFFGEEIETLRTFDPTSQRSVQKLDKALISPAQEVFASQSWQPVSSGFESDQRVDEFYLPLANPFPASIFDYLPDNSLIVMDDASYLQATSVEIEEQSIQLRQEAIEAGVIAEDFPIPYLSLSELMDTRAKIRMMDMGFSSEPQAYGIASHFSPPPRFGGKLDVLLESLDRAIFRNQQVSIVSRQASRLEELWEQQKGKELKSANPIFIDDSLAQGFCITFQDDKILTLLTDNEVFGWERPQPRRKVHHGIDTPESAFADLKAGDWVVHVDYGIGHFIGLVKRSLEGTEREFLCIEFANNDQLFVPVHQADRLSLYIGPDERPPKPTRLGGIDWQVTKGRVRNAVKKVAWDLLDLYARRQTVKGFAFQPDTIWQKELEASFPFIETEDQLKAITAVKNDMENERPMDRLLCGDVGYGKTEVALRAAFKAVMSGRQVAMLVPTTVLAQQHYDTFQQRLSPFPVAVSMLSRFKSPAQQNEIVTKVRRGEVDIVIGTHRLLQSDVIFKNLGLLIVDEEQRFGVAHKEYLKNLRTEVDVLTLTATPIPRTLYMSLSGVKDISIINTPPSDRLPIVTFVGQYDQNIVRRAILRELDRKGQVFFVHNRVQTIVAVASNLRRLIPEARVAIGHGQMPENELSEVMHAFTKGEVDVLLSTSIIESGLDIPNANTLIVDRGDTFGLAQLYQLRGRVGRGSQRAYAYFFYNNHRPPTEESRERLEIIAENSQLGSGYSIAMRDLEMRGAGDLLGTQQHGHIASVGFHLYTRLLSQAVNELRKERNPDFDESSPQLKKGIKPLVIVELPLPIGIPTEYVKDQNVRIQLYRRLAEVQSEEIIAQTMNEFEDRFGEMVEEVSNLFFQLRVRLLAEKAGLASIAVENNQLVLKYPPLEEGVKARVLSNLSKKVRAGKNSYWIVFDKMDDEWKERLLNVLKELGTK